MGAGPSFVKIAEDRPLYDDSTRCEDAALQSDRSSCKDVVTGTHLDRDACTRAVDNGAADTLTQGILDTGDGDENKIARKSVVGDLHKIVSSRD